MAPRDGRLDEISASIGGLKAQMQRLTELFDRHCVDDDARHKENTGTLREIKEALQPLLRTVASMEPIVKAAAIAQSRRAWALGLALGALGLVAWLVEQAIAVAIGWIFHR
jgi:hypothetical protein